MAAALGCPPGSDTSRVTSGQNPDVTDFDGDFTYILIKSEMLDSDTRYQIPDTRYDVGCIFQIPDTRYHTVSMVSGFRYQIPDTKRCDLRLHIHSYLRYVQIPDTMHHNSRVSDTRYHAP